MLRMLTKGESGGTVSLLAKRPSKSGSRVPSAGTGMG